MKSRHPLRDSVVPTAEILLLGLVIVLFNSRSTQAVLTVALVIVLVAAGALFYLARHSGKTQPPPMQAEQALRRLYTLRKIMLWTCAGLITAAILMAGLLSRNYLPRSLTAQVLLLVFCGLPFLLAVLNQLLLRRESRRWDQATDQQMIDYLASHRETDRSPELFREMLRFRRLAGVFTLALAVAAVGLAFTAGLVCRKPGWLVPPFLLAYLCLICTLARIRLKIPGQIIRDLCVDPSEYPILYAMAGKAQRALGCTGEIRIDISSECNAGLAVSDGTNYLALGATLLAILTEEELQAVLLHEFGHAAASTEAVRNQSDYSLWLDSESSGRVMDFILFAFFGYFDMKYSMKYHIYEYAVSLRQEFSADRAMIDHGDPAQAGSALLKLAYFDYYRWENTREPSPYAAETMSRTSLRDSVARFRTAIEQRSQVWNGLAEKEIQSQAASHPTLKARLDAMGIQEITTVPGHRSPAFQMEVRKALAYVDNYIYETMAPDFEKQRNIYYLEPLADVEKWEARGRPLEPRGYPDIVLALRILGRSREAEELCDRAIRELPESPHALYVKGTMLLHRYDPAGIEYICRAIRSDPGYREEGMEEVGNFCCLTGRQQEPESHRRMAGEA